MTNPWNRKQGSYKNLLLKDCAKINIMKNSIKETEAEYYHTIVGLHGEKLFADNMQTTIFGTDINVCAGMNLLFSVKNTIMQMNIHLFPRRSNTLRLGAFQI